MSQVRAAAVAGQFYPGKQAQLQQEVDALLADAQSDLPCPKALVAPHAGYIYSGPIAAEVYARVKNGAENISRVILLGPSHRVAFTGIATSSADFYVTPLGQVPLDRATLERIEAGGLAERLDQAHSQEHSLEVHLPFLQRCLNQFTLVPLVVGQADVNSVAKLIDELWGGKETLIVISSDLSHYLPYQKAQQVDFQTTRLIEQRQPIINGKQACGCRALNGLLQLLQQRKLDIDTVQVKNSGDTAGKPDRVVGYGAWVVNEPDSTASIDTDPPAQVYNLAQRQQLLSLARAAILHEFEGGGEMTLQLNQYHPALREERGCFVTLNWAGRLRGCIGSLAASRPLLLDVVHNAKAAAFKDRRFKPLTIETYPGIDIHISVLSPAQDLLVSSREELIEQLRPGVDGVILQEGQHRSTYLPSVWEKIPDPDTFVSELRAKAGLPREGWSEAMQVAIYTTEEFS